MVEFKLNFIVNTITFSIYTYLINRLLFILSFENEHVV